MLIGEGEARVDGRVMPAREALARSAASRRSTLAPKEGLALLNGTQVSTALALAGLFAAERAMAAAFVAGALSVDACLGSDTPFDARIHAVRGHRGQLDAARDLSRPCSPAAPSAPRTSIATACRIRTACAASRR